MKAFPKFNKNKLLQMGLLCLVSMSSLSSCISKNKEFTLSTGKTGSTYIRIGDNIQASARAIDTDPVKLIDSEGSIGNLDQLLNHKTDFALMQLDVASEAMKKGQIQAAVVLANEYVHIIVRNDSPIKTFADLEGKRVADGEASSGTRFTATRLFKTSNLHVSEALANVDDSFHKLLSKEVDAVFLVNPLGTNPKIKTYLTENPSLRLLPLETGLINHLTIQFPESYQAGTISAGTYSVRPVQPSADINTISTATALVTRPDVDKERVNLLSWAIFSTSRQYAPFYPQLSVGEAKMLMLKGLVYVHPGAQLAFEQGDPRVAWLHYLQENKPLQAATIMFSMTSLIGYLIRRGRKQRSTNMIKSTRKTINELRSTLAEDPQQALNNVEALRQKHRLMLIDGGLSLEIYEQIERMTQVLTDECHKLRDQQYNQMVENTLILLDDWQTKFKIDPITSEKELLKAETNYRKMLLNGQVDIQTYIQLKQLIKQ